MLGADLTLNRRTLLASGAAASTVPALALPHANMRLMFDYQPGRDGLALLKGGPSEQGYQSYASSHPSAIWQPRFATETAAKGGGDVWNGEYQFYTDPEFAWSNHFSPFAIVNGNLRIRAQRVQELGFSATEIPNDPVTSQPYTFVSGALSSKQRFSQQGGYFEIVAQLPKGTGTWPAFWLLPVDYVHPPEIDIVEYLGHLPKSYRGNLFSINPANQHSFEYDAGRDLSNAMHKYAILWTDNFVSYYFDDLKVATTDISGKREFAQKFYILLNLAIGSRMSGWVPAPDSTTPSPSDMLIQSVRVWQRLGPTAIGLANTAILETAPVGSVVGQLSCESLDTTKNAYYKLLDDPDGKFAIRGTHLITRSTFSFLPKQCHSVLIQVTDDDGRTYQQPFSITVFDADIAPNALDAGSRKRLTDSAWEKSALTVTPDSGLYERLVETRAFTHHSIERLIDKPRASIRYIISADLKSGGRDWVKLEISANYKKPVIVFFNISTREIGDQYATPDARPFVLHECRMSSISSGFMRCQVDLTTDDSPALRVALKLVLNGSDYGLHMGDPTKCVISRAIIRAVRLPADTTP